MDRPLRVIGIIVCGTLLAAPQLVCFAGASPRLLSAAHTVGLLFPVTFWALSRFWLDEGRAQAREPKARQPRGLITFVACLILCGSALVLSKALCPLGPTDQARATCHTLSAGSTGVLGLLCSLPF